MYNPNNGRHYYTASSGERDFLIGIGWVYEKDAILATFPGIWFQHTSLGLESAVEQVYVLTPLEQANSPVRRAAAHLEAARVTGRLSGEGEGRPRAHLVLSSRRRSLGAGDFKRAARLFALAQRIVR